MKQQRPQEARLVGRSFRLPLRNPGRSYFLARADRRLLCRLRYVSAQVPEATELEPPTPPYDEGDFASSPP